MNQENSVVHQQYARKADLKVIVDRLVSALPSAFISLRPLHLRYVNDSLQSSRFSYTTVGTRTVLLQIRG